MLQSIWNQKVFLFVISAAKFKNPFDLMDEEEIQIIETKPQNNYNPSPYVPKGKVHTPLPFNPFEDSASTITTN